MWAALVQIKHQLAEDGVGPGEPGAREFLWIIFVKRLVHEAGGGVSVLEHLQTKEDFFIFRTG